MLAFTYVYGSNKINKLLLCDIKLVYYKIIIIRCLCISLTYLFN